MNQMALQVVIQSAMGITNQEHFKNLVKFADNGQKAVDHCKVSVPDLIFMDINMPVMNGYEASKQIKQIRDVHTRIIACSGESESEIRDTATEAGMDQIEQKPLFIEKVKGILKHFEKK